MPIKSAMSNRMSLIVIFFLLGPVTMFAGTPTSSLQDQTGAVPGVVRKDYDMRRLVESSVQPEPVAKGRRLWVQRCAHCHDPLGQPSPRALGPSLDAETVKSRGEEKTRQAIAIGSARMPGFQYTLQPAQIDHLIEFLNTVPTGNREPR